MLVQLLGCFGKGKIRSAAHNIITTLKQIRYLNIFKNLSIIRK